jgi:hypothetical protein
MDEKAHDKALQAGSGEGASNQAQAPSEEVDDRLREWRRRLLLKAQMAGEFKLMRPDADLERLVSDYFGWWRTKYPFAPPNDESREQCLDLAYEGVRHQPTFPRNKFIEGVAKYFDCWRAGETKQMYCGDWP